MDRGREWVLDMMKQTNPTTRLALVDLLTLKKGQEKRATSEVLHHLVGFSARMEEKNERKKWEVSRFLVPEEDLRKGDLEASFFFLFCSSSVDVSFFHSQPWLEPWLEE